MTEICEHKFKQNVMWIPYCLKCGKNRDQIIEDRGFTAGQKDKEQEVQEAWDMAWQLSRDRTLAEVRKLHWASIDALFEKCLVIPLNKFEKLAQLQTSAGQPLSVESTQLVIRNEGKQSAEKGRAEKKVGK